MPDSPRPRGRAAVCAALIESGTQLFAKRGLAAVSVRDVAKAARVNHGLVHRHFGSKAGLVRAVMAQLSDDIERTLGPVVDNESFAELMLLILTSSNRQRTHWRILAQAMLGGEDVETVPEGFAVFQRALAAARRNPPGRLSPEAQVAVFMAFGLGMVTYGPFIRRALDLSRDEWRATRSELGQLVQLSLWTLGKPHAS